MMDVKAAAGSLVITGIAAGGRMVIEATSTTGDNKDIFTSFGVFGAALAIAGGGHLSEQPRRPGIPPCDGLRY